MTKTFLAGVIGAALILSPLTFAQRPDNAQTARSSEQASWNGSDPEVQQAIAFERAKDRAADLQARLEARLPSVDNSSADRRMDDSTPGNQVRDPGPNHSKAAPVKKDE
jgi:hypothetical protein